jgi:VanZ family protein
MRAHVHRDFATLAILMVIVILHGSLYPYEFRIPPGGIGPIATLLGSWHDTSSSYGEMVANIMLYVPLGFFGVLALRLTTQRRLAIVITAGLVLCVAIELTQYYDTDRITSLADVSHNTLGTVLGAGTGVFFRADSRWPLVREVRAHPLPAIFIVAMMGFHLFPYVPTIDLHKYWDALKPIVLTPSIDPYRLFHYFALWLTVNQLVAAIVGRRRWLFYGPAFTAFVFVSKIFITSLALSVPEVVAAAAALALSPLLFAFGRTGTTFVALVLAAWVVAQRLEPFTFEARTASFGWLPFRGYLSGSLSVNIQSLCEKVFLYGSLVWLLREAGLRPALGAIAVAALLFATSWAELYLPGRSAEITDAVIAIVTAGIIANMTPRPTAPSGDALRDPDRRSGPARV